MTPVFQTRFGERGNCMQAAAASYLNLPLDAVPDFGEMEKPEWEMRKFFREHHFELRRVPPSDMVFYRALYYLVEGFSTQGHEHLVIYTQGQLAFDPNPHGRGLVRIDDVYLPVPQ